MEDIVLMCILAVFEPIMHLWAWISGRRFRRKRKEECLKNGTSL